jgi:predicted acyltransferase
MQPALTSATAPESRRIPQPAVRNVAMDAYRGFVMLLMMAEVLRLARVAQAFPGNWFWGVLAYNQTHVEWAGCSLHDLIQPSFSFLVGVALPYSIASRIAKGGTFGKLFAHALWRSLVLIALGIFLRSTRGPITNFTFEDTLTQIGLGYGVLFVLGFCRPRWQWGALAVILTGYWLAWALYPVAGPTYNYQAVGVPADWPHNYGGFAAHWNKNANLGVAFDQWFLNLFPRTRPFVANFGGYLTLSFIPTLATMILGLVAGRWLRAAAPNVPMKRLLVGGAIGIAAGLALHFTGICPVVKRIWTPSWTLFSGGACLLLLAAFSWLIDVKHWRKWSFPLIVIGMNSIAAYMIAHLFHRFFADSFRIHLGRNFFRALGEPLEPLLLGAAVLLAYWLVLFWMYRRKLFLRYVVFSFCVSVAVAISVLLQAYEWRRPGEGFVVWRMFGTTGRPGGTFDNPIYTGPYLLLHFFWGIFALRTAGARIRAKHGLVAYAWSGLLLTGECLVLMAIIAGLTRGVILGLLPEWSRWPQAPFFQNEPRGQSGLPVLQPSCCSR